MKRAYFIVIVAVVLSLAVLAVPSAMAQNISTELKYIVDPTSSPYGRTYSEWASEWNQWSYSIPVAQHPLFDNGDCSVGQSGPVFFLGGKFCANGAICSYTVVRNCSVPSGKAIFFPVADFEDSALEESVNEHPGDVNYQQIGYMRSYVSSVETGSGFFCKIDGKAVKDLTQKFGFQSTAFVFTIPDDNLLKAVYPPPNNFEAGAYFPGVDDGYYLMLSLPPGNHVLHFGASWLDVTYNLTVAK